MDSHTTGFGTADDGDEAGLTYVEASPAMPAVVVFCGRFSGDDIRSIRGGVRSRLETCFPLKMLQWLEIQTPSGALRESLERVVEPLRNISLREELADKGLLERITGTGELSTRIIVIAHAAVAEELTALEDLLLTLGTELSTIPGLRAARPILIGVGDAAVGLGNAAVLPYWPRFRMGMLALGGALASNLLLNDTLENLLVALLASELSQIVDSLAPGETGGVSQPVDASIEPEALPEFPAEPDALDPFPEGLRDLAWGASWIVVGASALSVNIPEHHNFMQQLTYRHLMQPFLSRGLPVPERQSIQEHLQPEIESFLDEAAEVAWSVPPLLQHWRVRFGPTPPRASIPHALIQAFLRVTRLDRRGQRPAEPADDAPGRPRRVHALEPAPTAPFRGASLTPFQDLTQQLTSHYQDVRTALVRHLPARAMAARHRLIDLLGSFALPDVVAEDGQVAPEAQRPWGLDALVAATESAIELLRDATDLNHHQTSVLPYLDCNEETCARQAGADAWFAQAQSRRNVRFARVVLTILGTALYLLPAWPVLAAFLALIPGLGTWWAAVVAVLVLATVALTEYWAANAEVRRLASDVEDQHNTTVARSVLRIVAWGLWEQRRALVSRLEEVRFLLRHLSMLLNQQYQDAVRNETYVQERYVTHRATGSIYRLSNLTLCRQWAEEAAEEATRRRLLVETLSECLAPFLSVARSPACVARQIKERLDAAADEKFSEGHLMPYVLAEDEPLLAGGRRWRWLYDRAHPLGDISGTAKEPFGIVVVGEPAATATAAGDSSPHWTSDWKTARSRQPFEIICIRGIVDEGDPGFDLFEPEEGETA